MSVYPKFSAALGALGVALGAFGAHGLKQTLDLHQTGGIWQTASLYHLLHSVALLSLCSRSPVPKAPFWCFSIGILIFSGSLYALALTNIKPLGAITPVGGLLLIGGWLLLFNSRGRTES
jgi:uncharacterized membrane protein YgdD (TMEM256/DUF423 family)